MKRSVILTDRLGPDILSAFWTKGQVLHRERAHLKVPGISIVLNVLLTRKLPTILSRLNEISDGCEKIAPVSGSFQTSESKKLRIQQRGTQLFYYFSQFFSSSSKIYLGNFKDFAGFSRYQSLYPWQRFTY